MHRLRRYRIGIPLSNVAAHTSLAVTCRRIRVASRSRAKLRKIAVRSLAAA